MSYYPYYAPAPVYPSYTSSILAADAAAAASARAAADIAVARSYVPLSPRYSSYAADAAIANAHATAHANAVASDIALSASVRRARLAAYSPYY